MSWAVLLTGDHATIARAELEAQLGPATWLGPRVAVVDAPGPAIARLAYLREAGPLVASIREAPGTIEALAATVATSAAKLVDVQTVAVAATRTGKIKTEGYRLAQQVWGEALSGEYEIDLSNPGQCLAAWFHDGRVTAAWRQAVGATDHNERTVENRAHFSPVSLHPRLAKALVHLTGCQPGATIYDPFCGTGGIVMEAAISGYKVMASDRDPWMVQGTMATLTDAWTEPLDGDVFEADIADAPELAGTVDGIVTDLPYGGASTTNKEPIAELYKRAFEAFAKMLAPGSRAVIGFAEPKLLAPIVDYGFTLEQTHEEFVHKSLTRRFAVVKRTA